MACCRASFDPYIRVVDSSFAARFVVGRARLTSRSCSKPELLIIWLGESPDKADERKKRVAVLSGCNVLEKPKSRRNVSYQRNFNVLELEPLLPELPDLISCYRRLLGAHRHRQRSGLTISHSVLGTKPFGQVRGVLSRYTFVRLIDVDRAERWSMS